MSGTFEIGHLEGHGQCITYICPVCPPYIACFWDISTHFVPFVPSCPSTCPAGLW